MSAVKCCVMFRDRSEHRLKHSESTVLTSANPQLQAEVFVSTAALELACQQDRILKKQGLVYLVPRQRLEYTALLFCLCRHTISRLTAPGACWIKNWIFI